MIRGFTKGNNCYYMVADQHFCHCYSLYGFCSVCGILRCSPVWCICGHKELSNGWTGGNEKLDRFIRKSQLQTISANEAYLEWIPFDQLNANLSNDTAMISRSLLVCCEVELIPLDISEKTNDLYYHKVRPIRLCS